ncbi:hypothetical protein D3C75_951020 [compost metagenome]
MLPLKRICASFWYLLNTNGPVPIGFWLMSAALPSLSSWSAYSADWIEAKLMARFWMNAASTPLRVNLTVWSSSFSTLAMFLSMPMSVKYGNSVG